MRFGRQTPPPRHLAGHVDQAPRPADFDVDAALTDPDFDFEALFVDEDELEDPGPRTRVARHRIAFAVSVTLAALPLLVLDNLPATAGTDGTAVESTEPTEPAAEGLEDTVDQLRGTIDLEELERLEDLERHTPVTAGPAAVFIADPTTTAPPTTAEASTTSTAEAPAPSTTAAPTTTAPRPAPTTTAPRPAPTTTAAPARAVASPDPNDPATWDRLAKCEASGNWAANTGNGYYGGLQFSLPTWQSVGGTGYPHEASRETQIEMGKRLHARAGWSAWPGCARKLGW